MSVLAAAVEVPHNTDAPNLFGVSLNMYEGIYAIVVNLAIGAGDHADETRREDYEERVESAEEPLPVTAGQEAHFHREAEPTRRP